VPKLQKYYQRASKALLITIIGVIMVGLLVYAFRFQILTGLAKLLIVDEQLQPADVIFILAGDVNSRPFYAAELFKQGLAPQIVMAREEDLPAVELGFYPNGTDVVVGILKKLGIPEENITVIAIEGGATSTRDESQILRYYVDQHNIKRVILVTTAFHTRRSKWIFKKALSGSGAELEVTAAPQWKFDETNWWQNERGLITFANEYIKLFYYFVVY